MKRRKTWMERTLAGEVVDVDAEKAAWMKARGAPSLPVWLGLTEDECILFVEKPHALPAIVARRLAKTTAHDLDTLWSAVLALAAGEPIEDQAVELAALGVDTSPLVALRDRLAMAPPPPPRVTMADPITALELSQRAHRALWTAGIRTVGDLTARTAADLLALPGFGAGCLSDVETALARHGLALKGGAS